MLVSEYRKLYTRGDPIYFKFVLGEVRELFDEVIVWNVPGMREEFEDVLHYTQLWLYSRYGIDMRIWHATRHSVDKFIKRNGVWREMYAYLGLPKETPAWGGNYNRVQKVIDHLARYGISEEKSEEVYKKFVADKK